MQYLTVGGGMNMTVFSKKSTGRIHYEYQGFRALSIGFSQVVDDLHGKWQHDYPPRHGSGLRRAPQEFTA